MKNIEIINKITSNNDNINLKLHVQLDVTELISSQPKENDCESVKKALNEIEDELKENDVKTLGNSITDCSSQKKSKSEPSIIDNNEKRRRTIERVNIILTLFFSFSLLVVSFAQYKTYNRQADISMNANKLAQYQFRFEFYEKLEDLQKEVSVVKKTPELDTEKFHELSYEILSLYRESTLLFDKNTSDVINKIFEEHMQFLIEINNIGMQYVDYEKEMNKLNREYGEFINSDDFKKYIDINLIQ